MSRDELFYLSPYLLSLLISFGVFLYTWAHRQVKGAGIYAWLAAGQSLTIAGFLFELLNPNLPGKIFWDKVQWLTDSYLVTLPVVIFSIRFSDHKVSHPRVLWSIIGFLLLAFTALLLTDPLHHLVYANPRLTTDYPFPDLTYSFTPLVYAYFFLYLYGAVFYGIVLLLRRAFQPNGLYQSQNVIIVLGLAVPLILTFFPLLNIKILPQRDTAPISFAIGNLIVAWGLFRYRLFNLIPVARQHIIDDMNDPVVILDHHNLVVDLNSAALKLIENRKETVIGKPFHSVFDQWPAIIRLLDGSQDQKTEISSNWRNETIFFDISVSPIFNKRGSLVGRIITAHEITAQKNLEMRYRSLSEELDQRVLMRTAELHESEQKYRLLLETLQDGVWAVDADAKTVYVNRSMAEMLGYTEAEMQGKPIFQFADAQGIEILREKLRRRRQGLSEQYDFEFLRKDGQRIYTLVQVGPILDGAGRYNGSIASIKNITDRRQAEQELAESRALLDSIFNSTGDWIWAVEPETFRMLIFNDGLKTFFWKNYGIALRPGLLPEDLDPDELDHPLWRAYYQRALREGPFQIEHQTTLKTNTLQVDFVPLKRDAVVFAVAVIATDITERVLAQEKLLAYNQRLQNLSRRLVAVQENERRQIARELHDEIGQSLTGLKLLLEMARYTDDPQAIHRLSEAQTQVNELLKRIRQLSLDLRPAMLDDLGLLPALLWLFERYTAQTRIQVCFRHSGIEGCRFSSEIETATYRIAQEALTNIARYAQVQEANANVWADANQFCVEIEDKGQGFDVDAALSSGATSGLAGMRERATLLGGTLSIYSSKMSGTRLVANLPMHKTTTASGVG